MERGTIILLNGVSSSGKSSLSKQLVARLPDFFHLAIDDYDIIIERMEDRESERLIPVPTEDYFHRTVAMFANSGVNLVVDQILHDAHVLRDCVRTLTGFPVLFVGVHCQLEELQRREVRRGDRNIGQAKKQLAFVHQQQESYDVEVDTSKEKIEECAQRIVEHMVDRANWTGWALMKQKMTE